MAERRFAIQVLACSLDSSSSTDGSLPSYDKARSILRGVHARVTNVGITPENFEYYRTDDFANRETESGLIALRNSDWKEAMQISNRLEVVRRMEALDNLTTSSPKYIFEKASLGHHMKFASMILVALGFKDEDLPEDIKNALAKADMYYSESFFPQAIRMYASIVHGIAARGYLGVKDLVNPLNLISPEELFEDPSKSEMRTLELASFFTGKVFTKDRQGIEEAAKTLVARYKEKIAKIEERYMNVGEWEEDKRRVKLMLDLGRSGMKQGGWSHAMMVGNRLEYLRHMQDKENRSREKMGVEVNTSFTKKSLTYHLEFIHEVIHMYAGVGSSGGKEILKKINKYQKAGDSSAVIYVCRRVINEMAYRGILYNTGIDIHLDPVALDPSLAKHLKLTA